MEEEISDSKCCQAKKSFPRPSDRAFPRQSVLKLLFQTLSSVGGGCQFSSLTFCIPRKLPGTSRSPASAQKRGALKGHDPRNSPHTHRPTNPPPTPAFCTPRDSHSGTPPPAAAHTRPAALLSSPSSKRRCGGAHTQLIVTRPLRDAEVSAGRQARRPGKRAAAPCSNVRAQSEGEADSSQQEQQHKASGPPATHPLRSPAEEENESAHAPLSPSAATDQLSRLPGWKPPRGLRARARLSSPTLTNRRSCGLDGRLLTLIISRHGTREGLGDLLLRERVLD